jgi:hypothetical protein
MLISSKFEFYLCGERDVASMLISSKFEFYLYLFGGCRQFRVSAFLLGRPADGRAIYIKPAGHFSSMSR